MASTVDSQADYMSQHFSTNQRPRLDRDEKESVLVFASTESPKSTKAMSTARKIAASFITVSHFFALWALYDMVFVLNATQGIKWFVAACVLYYVTGVQGITAGAHRLWAHRSYTAALPVRVWLMLMNTMANQGPIITWATEHRIHHLHVDTDADPHNINRGFFFAHMGWLFTARTDAFAEAKKHVMVEDLYADPVAKWQDKHYSYFSLFMCYVVPTLVGYFWANDALRGFLYLANLRWVLLLHVTWCINSVSHTFGDRLYNPNGKATENLFTSVLSGGEGWHDFHHLYASDYRACDQQSLAAFNDPSGIDWRFNGARAFIDLYAALGGVSNRRVLHTRKSAQH